MASLVAQMVKNPPAMQETQVPSLGQKDPWKRAWQPTPVFFPGESPWTEEPGGLQSIGSQRVRHDWVTKRIHKVLVIDSSSSFFYVNSQLYQHNCYLMILALISKNNCSVGSFLTVLSIGLCVCPCSTTTLFWCSFVVSFDIKYTDFNFLNFFFIIVLVNWGFLQF